MGVRPNGGRNAKVQKGHSMNIAVEQDQRVLTLAEAAQFLKVSERTLWQRTKSGEVPSFRLGVQHRFLISQLEAWAIAQGKDGE